MEVAAFELTLDIVVINQPANQVNGFQAQLPQGLGLIQSHPFFELILPRPLANAHVATIAARCAPANLVGLQQDNAIAKLAQMDGGG